MNSWDTILYIDSILKNDPDPFRVYTRRNLIMKEMSTKDYSLYCILILVNIAGIWVSSYLSKHGELTAVKESLVKMTEGQEQIKARISGELLVEQKLWDLKRETYWELTNVLRELSTDLWDLLHEGFLPDEKTINPDKRITQPLIERFSKNLDKKISLTAPSFIVLCPEAIEALQAHTNKSRQITKEFKEGKLDTLNYYKSTRETNDDLYNKIIEIAKKDLSGNIRNEKN